MSGGMGQPGPRAAPSEELDLPTPVKEKTHEFPALEPDADAVPEAVDANDDTTVPVHSSIETALVQEALRRQSAEKDDEGEGKGGNQG